MSRTVRSVLLWVLIAASVTVGLGLIMRTGSVCPTAGFFGIPCPFCGLTRAALFAVDGNYAASFESNPMLVPVLCGILVGNDWLSREFDKRYRGRKCSGRVHGVLIGLLLAAVTVVYFVRLPGLL